MKFRLVPFILAAAIAGAVSPTQAAQQPKDPDKAPIASVDRFSDAAGTLLKRSADPQLPGPNQPIDFDKQPFNALGLSPTGKPALYYHLDVRPTTPAPVYILYREGENIPVPDQLEVIDTVPGEKGYNDFRQVWKVWVPKDYVANTITDTATLAQSVYKKEKTSDLINMPVVPDKSSADRRYKGGKTVLRRAWYQGQIAKFFVFDEAPLTASQDQVPTSPIYDGFTANPGTLNGGEAFRMEPNSRQTHNIVATVPGDTGYSPLWLRIVYDSAAWPSVHNLQTAIKAKVVPADLLLINCPIVWVEQ